MFTATVVGNVVADAELRYLPTSKKPVLGFRVAANGWRSGKETVTWLNISFFGERAEKIAVYVKKGKQVAISGEVYNRPYEKDGEQRYSLEIDANTVKLLGGNDATKSTAGDMAATTAQQNYSSAEDLF